MLREEPVHFKNRTKQEIYGIAHIPFDNITGKKAGVIFLNPGPGYRIAHNRLYVNIGRRLALRGLYVLRFDPAGLGESEGDIEETMLFDLFTSINKGRFIHDTVDAANFFMSKYELEEIILVGLCGGAMTALLASPGCKNLRTLILLSFPVLFSSWEAENESTNPVYARERLRNYLINLINFNVASLDSWRASLKKIKERGLYGPLVRLLRTSISATKKDPLNFHPNFNTEFFGTFEKVKKDIDINFIFGENDRWKLYFESEFEQKLVKEPRNYRKFIIKNANHLFTLRKYQDDLINLIDDIIFNDKSDSHVEATPLNRVIMP